MKRERIRGAVLAAAGAACLALAAPAANAAVTVGQISAETDPNNCPPATMLITTTVASGTPYTVPAGGGVITSWQTAAGPVSGATAKLKVFRATLDANQFLVVGQSGLQTIVPGDPGGPSQLNGPFPVRIPVQAGDFVSLRPGNSGGPCNILTGNVTDSSRISQGEPDTANGLTTAFGPTPNTEQRANVSATLEPDADADGFGDESQDNCVGSGGPQAGCPLPPVVPPQQPAGPKKKKKKKCKKGKKRTAPAPHGVLADRCKKKKK